MASDDVFTEPDVDLALKVNFWWHFSQGAVHDHRTLKTLLYFHEETEEGRYKN